jgi:hypothetical protein
MIHAIFLFKERENRHSYRYPFLHMANLLDQLRTVVNEGVEARGRLTRLSQAVAQTSQIAYSINCIALHVNNGNPTRETLRQALPPVYDGTSESTERTVEYIRRTMIAVRSLLSEKMEEAFRAQSDLTQVHRIIGDMSSGSEPLPAIEQLDDDDVEEIVQTMVPLSVRPEPTTKGEKKDKKPRKIQRPWLLT